MVSCKFALVKRLGQDYRIMTAKDIIMEEIRLNERLSDLMEERGIDTKKLSDLTKNPIQSINRWKRGSNQIYLSNLIKLCDTLDCSLEFLVGRTETILDYTPQKCPPFYERLREIMDTKGITRYRLVKETKIYDNYFTVWKKGRDPQLYTLIELANYLGCTIDYLIGREK